MAYAYEPNALGEVNVLCDQDGEIALRFGDATIYRDVRVRRALPLTDPDHYIVFLDAQGRELCVVRDPRDLSSEGQAILKETLERDYLTSQIGAILSLRTEGEACHINAETSRGRREFVVANLQEGLRRLTDTKLLFLDSDGNKFEIEDVRRLDRRSLALLKKVV